MTERHHHHPSVFMFLITPFGAINGYLTVALAYLLAQRNVSVEAIAALIAASFGPNVWKFLWAPFVDTTFTSKTWYVIGTLFTAFAMFTMSVLPMTPQGLPLLTTVVVVGSFAATLVGMATDSLMARCTSEEEKGRAGGWFQAGNLGGGGVGGGLGLVLAQRLSAPWMTGAILAVLCLLCMLALTFVPEPKRDRPHGAVQGVKFVAGDLWKLARARMGFMALFLCFLPIGSGAASGLWSAVARDWRASANTVAMVTGVMGGIVMAIGSLAGGWICDRMNRKAAYAAYGVLQAMCAVGMALSPRDEHMFVVWTTVYAFITGLTYAGFTAFVLEAMGAGAAATKYNLFASLSNFPIMYMTTIDGSAHTRWGASGMLYAEAAIGLTGLITFLLFAAVVRRWWPVHWPERVEAAIPAPIE